MKTNPATNLREVSDCGGKSDATPLWHRATLLELSDASARAKAPSRPTCRRTPRRWRDSLAPFLLRALLLAAVFLAGGAVTATRAVTNLTVSAGYASRVLSIVGGTVEISQLTIAKGLPPHFGSGGGISNAAVLAIKSCLLRDNWAYSDSNVNSPAGGGGIFNSGILTLCGSTLSNNLSFIGFGGGILNDGVLSVLSTSIQINKSDGEGAGIFQTTRGTFTLHNCKLSDNQTYTHGGGLANNGGLGTIADSIISGNQTLNLGDGGGI
jgi:hypothetical protein